MSRVRSTMLTVALLVAGIMVLGSGLANNSYAEEKKVYKWRLAMTWPTNFPIFGDARLPRDSPPA